MQPQAELSVTNAASRSGEGPGFRRDNGLLSVSEAATYLGVCRKTIYRHLKSGSLGFARVGSKLIRIREEDLLAFLNSATPGASSN